MDARPNAYNKVLPLITANGVLIVTNGSLIATNISNINTSWSGIASNASDIATNAAAIAAMGYVDRGDPDIMDFQSGELEKDGNWYTMDLSAIVGAARRLVHLKLEIGDSAGGKHVKFRTNGNTYTNNVAHRMTVTAGTPCQHDVWVYTDDAGKIEYSISSATWIFVNIFVKGWWLL